MISKSRSSHKSPKRSRSRSREDDRHRRKDDRRDSRNSYRSDERYRRDDHRRYESKEFSRSDRDRDRRSSKSRRDHLSSDSVGRSHRDSVNSRSNHRYHHSDHHRSSDTRDGNSRESQDSNRHRSSESSRSDAHSRRQHHHPPTTSSSSSSHLNESDGQSRLGFNSPSSYPLVNNHLGTMNRVPFLTNLTPTNSIPLIPNPLIMTPSMLTPSTSTLLPTNLVSVASPNMPRYYNPSTFNAAKYAIQEEKKKLLWGPTNKDVSQQSNKVWQGLQFSGAQGQQMTEKFLKLMGSKPTTSSGQLDNADSMVKYQETLFKDLDKQYSAARMSTHINRGIGLGFSSHPAHK